MPRTRLPEVLHRIDAIVKRHDLQVANVFHAGDGNLHPCLLFDERQPGATERVWQQAAEIMRLCVDVGGAITGEHGVGIEKREFLAWSYSETDLGVMQKLRTAFGATDRFNPGKIFPEGNDGSIVAVVSRHFPRASAAVASGLWV